MTPDLDITNASRAATRRRSLLALTACLVTLAAGTTPAAAHVSTGAQLHLRHALAIGSTRLPGPLLNEAAPFNAPARVVRSAASGARTTVAAASAEVASSGSFEHGSLRNELAPFNQPSVDA